MTYGGRGRGLSRRHGGGEENERARTANPSCLGALVVQPPSLIYHKDTKTPRMRRTERVARSPHLCSESRLQAVFGPPTPPRERGTPNRLDRLGGAGSRGSPSCLGATPGCGTQPRCGWGLIPDRPDHWALTPPHPSPLTLTLSPRRGRGNKCLCHGAEPGSPSPYPFAPSGIPAKVSKPDSMGRGNNAQVAALVFPLALPLRPFGDPGSSLETRFHGAREQCAGCGACVPPRPA